MACLLYTSSTSAYNGQVKFHDSFYYLKKQAFATVLGIVLMLSLIHILATFFTVVAIGTKSGIEPITCAVVGALLGFLLFNVYPASVFMGDTGSLALGGFVASTAYMLQMPLFIIIVGLIYLVEVLSVMIQVTYFKKTGGKRFFKMAPIHHHFELCGWSETRVVAVFSIVTADVYKRQAYPIPRSLIARSLTSSRFTESITTLYLVCLLYTSRCV